jgi:nitrous oxidase accessory protein NosD
MIFANRVLGRAPGRGLWGAIVAITFLGLVAGKASAETHDVNALHDAGIGGCDLFECTLREAVVASNNDGEPSTVTFSVSGSLTVDSLPTVTGPLEVDGTSAPGFVAGAPSLTVNFSGGRLFNLASSTDLRGLDIAGSSGTAIDISHPAASGSVIAGNRIHNVYRGVYVRHGVRDVVIGGDSVADRNLIYGTASESVWIQGATGAKVLGNYIGTSGSSQFESAGQGIRVDDDADGTQIGGELPGQGNLISGSTGTGIVLWAQSGTRIIGNRIGTTPDGAGSIPNNSGGVLVYGPTQGVEIEKSTIAFNGQSGVAIRGDATTGVRLIDSSIHSNQGPEIDLDPYGPNVNDRLDLDEGANEKQNFPELDSAAFSSSGSSVSGTLDSVPTRDYRLDFYASSACSSSGYGPGRVPIGSFEVTTGVNGLVSFDGDVGALPADARYLTATATSERGSTSEFSPCIAAHEKGAPYAPDFKVTTLAGVGAGSLREAIVESNREPGQDSITFDVSGDIAPYTELPPITDPVLIDGLSAPGATPQRPSVSLYGYRIPSSVGLDVEAPATVKGLGIYTFFQGTGIRVGPTANGSRVEANEIGQGNGIESGMGNGTGIVVLGRNTVIGGDIPMGNTVGGNGGAGVRIESSGVRVEGNWIGVSRDGQQSQANGEGISLGPAADGSVVLSNHISANDGAGILVSGVAGFTLEGNRIGSNPAGAALPNNPGIQIENSSSVSMGQNTVSRNLGSGIRLLNVAGLVSSLDRFAANEGPGADIDGNWSNVNLSNSSFHANLGLAIDLAADGVTGNDSGDTDEGPNSLQNFPVLESVEFDAHQSVASGALDAAANESFQVTFYASSVCDPTGHGEGDVRLGDISISTGPAGTAGFSRNLPRPPSGKLQITAVATSDSGSTSEFSGCVKAIDAPPSYEVKSLSDDGDGYCDSTCTLRDAILTSNLSPDLKTISFLRSGIILPSSQLPELTTPVVIDGTTAPGAEPGAPSLGIDGLYVSQGPGLSAAAPVTIKGIRISGFHGGSAIKINEPAVGSVIQGNQIGDPQDQSSGNQRGILISADETVVGGIGSPAQNLVAGSEFGNIVISGAKESVIQGNLIGDTRLGGNALKSTAGIALSGDLRGTIIGGETQEAGNTVSGNAGWGIHSWGASGVTTRNNLIGTTPSGSQAAPNLSGGVFVGGNSSNFTSSRDLIAFNAGPGVRLEQPAEANDFGESRFHSNSGLGLDLGNPGVSPNDPGDSDLGPNGLQNFPTILEAAASDTGIRIKARLDHGIPGGLAVDFYASSTCDASGYGEGAVHLGTVSQYFESSGVTEIAAELPFPDSRLRQITATMTSADGTSEFSECRKATGFDPPVVVQPPPRVKAIPKNGRTLVADPSTGTVRVTKPNGVTLLLTEETEIPVGSKVNATEGKVSVISADPGDEAFQSAKFSLGSFRVTQEGGQRLVQLELKGGRDRAGICSPSSPTSRTLRKLWGSGKGKFKTKGHRASATVRGTKWLTVDRCDGTLVRVREGIVEVRDFALGKTVTVRAGESYLARSR